MKWCRMGKDKIFKERYAPEQEIVIVPEDIMPRKVNVEDLMKELKAAKEEASYYKHKAAYHEALNEMCLKLRCAYSATARCLLVQASKPPRTRRVGSLDRRAALRDPLQVLLKEAGEEAASKKNGTGR